MARRPDVIGTTTYGYSWRWWPVAAPGAKRHSVTRTAPLSSWTVATAGATTGGIRASPETGTRRAPRAPPPGASARRWSRSAPGGRARCSPWASRRSRWQKRPAGAGSTRAAPSSSPWSGDSSRRLRRLSSRGMLWPTGAEAPAMAERSGERRERKARRAASLTIAALALAVLSGLCVALSGPGHRFGILGTRWALGVFALAGLGGLVAAVLAAWGLAAALTARVWRSVAGSALALLVALAA